MNDLYTLVAGIHRNCKADHPHCACRCGCPRQMYCACWAPVCVPCQTNWMRERDPEPGRPACAPPERLTRPE